MSDAGVVLQLKTDLKQHRHKMAVAVATIEHLNNCLVGQPDHDIALAADTQLILRDLRKYADM